MGNFINGYDKPRFRILDSNNNLIEEIDLDLTGEEGLVETYKDASIFHTLEKDKEIVKVKRQGKKRIEFHLSYTRYVQKSNAFKIQKILMYEENDYKLFLIPRRDVLARSFEVVYSGDEYSIGLNKGGINAQSNRLLELKWITKKLELPNWVDPDNLIVDFDEIGVV